MKNKRRIIGIVAATLLALVGTISLVGYVSSAKDDAVAQEALVDVYVVDEFVPVRLLRGVIVLAGRLVPKEICAEQGEAFVEACGPP